jgi:hypothetical protein
MSGAYTPGPWTVRRPRGGMHSGYPYQITTEETPAKIITAWGAISRRASAEGEANARLIALAPELFEYVQSSADNGCATAVALIQKATATRNSGADQ